MHICVFVVKEWRVHDVTRNQSVYRHLGYDEYDRVIHGEVSF